MPSARVYGKRHAYLLGTLILIVSSIWGGASGHNYACLLWARIFQGVGLAPFEALVNASVGDLFFVHERGKRMALSNLSLFGGAFFTPVIVGKMTSTMGWQWTFYFVAIFGGVLFPFLLFFVPETTFSRDALQDADTGGADGRTSIRGPPRDALQDTERAHHSHTSSLEKTPGRVNSSSPTVSPQKVSFARSLLPFNGRHISDSFVKLLLRPFPLFLHPGILWACLIQGTLIGWTVLIGIVLAAIMLGPPLWFNEVETGYMYTGAFIGALLGFAIAGLLSDWSARVLTRWNKGVYEPEFRLILVIPQLVFGCAGLYGFGITSADAERYGCMSLLFVTFFLFFCCGHDTHASNIGFWPDFFFSLEVLGMVLGAVASALYIVDAHRDIAVEAFTCLLVFKNIFSFGLTFSGLDWLIKGGVRHTFIIVASVQVGIYALTVLMCKCITLESIKWHLQLTLVCAEQMCSENATDRSLPGTIF